jgi:hypothetical protein
MCDLKVIEKIEHAVAIKLVYSERLAISQKLTAKC